MLYIVGWNIMCIQSYIPDVFSVCFIVCNVACDNTYNE